MKPQNHFDPAKSEFILEDMHPARPWLNYLWNDEVVASTDQFGNGFA